MVWTVLILVIFGALLVERMLNCTEKYQNQLIQATEMKLKLLQCNITIEEKERTISELKLEIKRLKRARFEGEG